MKLILFALAITGVVSWWLSGYDPKVTGQDRNADFNRRAIRCGITLLLVLVSLILPLLFIATVGIVALIWVGCASELFSGGFHKLVDPADDREFDPKESSRDLDQLAGMIKSGQVERAVALCRKMAESGDGSALAIEAQLYHLYSGILTNGFVAVSPALMEANGLCAQELFSDAASKLNVLLARDPSHPIATIMLMRIYGRDLKLPERASALLEQFARQPRVPVAFISRARELISEWNGGAPAEKKAEEGIESLVFDVKLPPTPARGKPVDKNTASVEELLADGQLTTAIQLLERQVDDQPLNFDLLLKLAEAPGVFCRDLKRAGKIVARIEAAHSGFSAEQIKLAKAKLPGMAPGVFMIQARMFVSCS